MTEADWEDCEDATEMLRLLGGRASERKVRLTCVAAVRASWGEIDLPDLVHLIEAGERFADDEGPAGAFEATKRAWYERTMAALGSPFDRHNALHTLVLNPQGIRGLPEMTCWSSLRRVAGTRLP